MICFEWPCWNKNVSLNQEAHYLPKGVCVAAQQLSCYSVHFHVRIAVIAVKKTYNNAAYIH